MIVLGSNNYTYTGRRKKTVRRVRKASPVFRPLQADNSYRRETPEYKSADCIGHSATLSDTSYKKEISSKYTLAPAYNKGAYQVISKENIKDIGR